MTAADRRGAALLFAVAASTMLAALGLASWHLARAEQQAGQLALARAKLNALAAADLDRALVALTQEPFASLPVGATVTGSTVAVRRLTDRLYALRVERTREAAHGALARVATVTYVRVDSGSVHPLPNAAPDRLAR